MSFDYSQSLGTRCETYVKIVRVGILVNAYANTVILENCEISQREHRVVLEPRYVDIPRLRHRTGER